MTDPCRPPAGTKLGTVHVLRRERETSVAEVHARWSGNDMWDVSSAGMVNVKVSTLAAAGWRYVGPVEGDAQ